MAQQDQQVLSQSDFGRMLTVGWIFTDLSIEGDEWVVELFDTTDGTGGKYGVARMEVPSKEAIAKEEPPADADGPAEDAEVAAQQAKEVTEAKAEGAKKEDVPAKK